MTARESLAGDYGDLPKEAIAAIAENCTEAFVIDEVNRTARNIFTVQL